jgi:hypothetical protein
MYEGKIHTINEIVQLHNSKRKRLVSLTNPYDDNTSGWWKLNDDDKTYFKINVVLAKETGAGYDVCYDTYTPPHFSILSAHEVVASSCNFTQDCIIIHDHLHFQSKMPSTKMPNIATHFKSRTWSKAGRLIHSVYTNFSNEEITLLLTTIDKINACIKPKFLYGDQYFEHIISETERQALLSRT